MIAMIARDVSSQPFLINMDNGKVERILPESSFVQFLGWKPDSQKVMVFKYFTDPYNAGEVDLKTSEYHAIEFPRYRGDLPVVDALAFSPDGKWMADALVYPRNPQEGKDYLLSIGIRDTQTQERKTIQETPFLKGIWADSLVWSADGQFLSWMTYKDLKTGWLPTNIQSELWINDRSAGKSKSIAVFEGNIGNARLSVWSPDSNKIAVVLVDDKDSSYLAGNIFLIDPLSGTRTQVSHFNQLRVSKLLWSGDSQWIFCNVSDEVSGAIWAVNVKSGNSFPVAGPVIKNSPFTILP
jgi:Tol biopolymer transport system component